MCSSLWPSDFIILFERILGRIQFSFKERWKEFLYSVLIYIHRNQYNFRPSSLILGSLFPYAAFLLFTLRIAVGPSGSYYIFSALLRYFCFVLNIRFNSMFFFLHTYCFSNIVRYSFLCLRIYLFLRDNIGNLSTQILKLSSHFYLSTQTFDPFTVSFELLNIYIYMYDIYLYIYIYINDSSINLSFLIFLQKFLSRFIHTIIDLKSKLSFFFIL